MQVLCLVIQTAEVGRVGLSAETITIDGYGVLMAIVTGVAVPIAAGSIYLIARDAREAKNPEDADAAAAARDSERLEKIKSTVIELEGTPELRRAMLALLSDAAEEAHPTDRSTLGAGAGRRAAPIGSAPARTMPQPAVATFRRRLNEVRAGVRLETPVRVAAGPRGLRPPPELQPDRPRTPPRARAFAREEAAAPEPLSPTNFEQAFGAGVQTA